MDRKSIVLLVACVLLIVSWPMLERKFYPPLPAPATNNVASVTNTVSSTNTASSTNAHVNAQAEKPVPFNPEAPEQTITISNDDAIYTFTSHGGGLKQVQIKRYPPTTEHGIDKNFTTNAYASLNNDALVPVLALLGGPSLQGDGNFTLTQTATGVRAEKALPHDITLVKEFNIGSNYLVTAKARFENHSQQAITLPPEEWVIGTAAPTSTRDKPDTVGFYRYDGSSESLQHMGWFRSASMLGCGSPTIRDYYEETGKIVWADVHSQFFTLTTVLKDPAIKIASHTIDLPHAKEMVVINKSAVTNGLQTSVFYASTNIAAGGKLTREFTIYAGPKEYNKLAKIAADMKNDLDLVMGFKMPGPLSLFGLTTFFAKMLLLSMNGLHSIFNGAVSYGWIIVVITVLIKLLFWPLTAASTRSAKRMQAFMPELKAIQEKYKDDPAKAQRKQMEFYREKKINPVGGCLPMVIQIPVFMGFYTMIRSAIELRGVHFLWAFDLTQPDTVGYLAGFPINILPIIYGATLLYQARITPVSPSMDPAQQQLMKYMPLMFMFILYTMSSGLTLYWIVQNSLTILQTKLTKTADAKTPDGKTNVEIIPPKKKK